jgi:hypothetical protein
MIQTKYVPEVPSNTSQDLLKDPDFGIMTKSTTTMRTLLLLLLSMVASLHATTALTTPNLQAQHGVVTPAEALRKMSESCEELGISNFDVYGDYHLGKFRDFV